MLIDPAINPISHPAKAYRGFRTSASKTVLFTGATGLLGRQVVAAFERKNWTVKGTGYSRADGVSILKVDLQDDAAVEDTLNDTA